MSNDRQVVDTRARELKSALQGVYPNRDELPTLGAIINSGDGFEERISWMPLEVQSDGISRLDFILEENGKDQDSAIEALYADLETKTAVFVESIKAREAAMADALARLDSLITESIPTELLPLRRSTVKAYRAQVINLADADLAVILDEIRTDLADRVVPLIRAQHDARKRIDALFARIGDAGVRGVARRSFKVSVDRAFELVVQRGEGGFDGVVEEAERECEDVVEEYGREREE